MTFLPFVPAQAATQLFFVKIMDSRLRRYERIVGETLRACYSMVLSNAVQNAVRATDVS
jgi:hypothetical protein